ncbi:hypothetical protein [Burkholderia gladioli]|uniref:hypothetical protein n=1 Tax=Burkholderia gladioli TaxID=28095 RepID=UPI00163F6B93|nr:hypothetical protein [Burkholderia gladioli]
MARAGAATVAAADVEPRNACIAPWMGVPRGAAPATGSRAAARAATARADRGGVRASAVASQGAATAAAADVELRNACIALWTEVPCGPPPAGVRGWRPAQRQHGSVERNMLATGVGQAAGATVARAVLELRDARIALWTEVPCGPPPAGGRRWRPARRQHGSVERSMLATGVGQAAAATLAAAVSGPRNVDCALGNRAGWRA